MFIEEEGIEGYAKKKKKPEKRYADDDSRSYVSDTEISDGSRAPRHLHYLRVFRDGCEVTFVSPWLKNK